jgi:hypothetical protein
VERRDMWLRREAAPHLGEGIDVVPRIGEIKGLTISHRVSRQFRRATLPTGLPEWALFRHQEYPEPYEPTHGSATVQWRPAIIDGS